MNNESIVQMAVSMTEMDGGISSVPGAFSVLRMFNQPKQIREISAMVLRQINSVLEDPTNSKHWKVSAHSDAYIAVCKNKRGASDLLVVSGWLRENKDGSLVDDDSTVYVLPVPGSAAASQDTMSALRLRKEEIEAELSILEGAKNLSAVFNKAASTVST